MKLNFCSVLQNAWLNAVTPAVICGGFKKAGVFPFDCNTVPLHDKSSAGGDHDGMCRVSHTHAHTSTHKHAQTLMHMCTQDTHTHAHTQLASLTRAHAHIDTSICHLHTVIYIQMRKETETLETLVTRMWEILVTQTLLEMEI